MFCSNSEGLNKISLEKIKASTWCSGIGDTYEGEITHLVADIHTDVQICSEDDAIFFESGKKIMLFIQAERF